MIKLVVFDWNGVLIADTRACMDADNHVLKRFGGKPVTLKEFRDTIIIPSIDFYVKHDVDRKLLDSNHSEWAKEFHGFYEERVAMCRSRGGAKCLLKWLKRKGIRPVILSNHTINGIEAQLNRLKMKDYIIDVLANPKGRTALHRRNKSQKSGDYIQKNNYKKQEVLIIGDSPEEAEISKKLGIKSVLIRGGYYSTHRLKAAKPDYLIGNLNEVIGIIKSLSKTQYK